MVNFTSVALSTAGAGRQLQKGSLRLCSFVIPGPWWAPQNGEILGYQASKVANTELTDVRVVQSVQREPHR